MKIVAAAVQYKGLTFSVEIPGRHCDVLRLMVKAGLSRPIRDDVQGFLTNVGTFVDRVEAGRIAIEAGQLPSLPVPPDLYSEDLW